MGLREKPESREQSHGRFVAIRRQMEDTRVKLLESEERVVVLQDLIEKIKQHQAERREQLKGRGRPDFGESRPCEERGRGSIGTSASWPTR